MTKLPCYVIVSPVKDEERYVEHTLKSVTRQSLRPLLWVIIDDGSTDATPEIIGQYLPDYPFIRLIRNTDTGERQLAFKEVRAFNFGCKYIDVDDYDFLIKLDCDLSFEPDYFEQLLQRFAEDPTLGIASGVYFEQNPGGAWHEILMPSYHAAGASKVMRRSCFEDFGGFIPAPGWDTVDEIRAMNRGWRTCHFRNLKLKHHKREGSTIGAFNTSLMQGEAYYRSGGSKLFFIFKVIDRVTAWPFLTNALGLVLGYFRAFCGRKPLLVTKSEADSYKALLRARLTAGLKSLMPQW